MKTGLKAIIILMIIATNAVTILFACITPVFLLACGMMARRERRSLSGRVDTSTPERKSIQEDEDGLVRENGG